MKKDDGMSKDSMSKDTMKKDDGMAKDSMVKDKMAH
jgi:pentapeptide MXKDX repeat protein